VVSGSRGLEAGGEARTSGNIGPLAWLLLAAAVVHFGVDLLLPIGSARPFPPEPERVLFAVRAASAFGAAAAVVIGAGNWPRGRRFLMLGATALALNGVLELLGQGTLHWVLQDSASDAPARMAATEGTNYVRAFLSALAAAMAPPLLAAGLWWGAQNRAAAGPWRRWLIGLVGVIGLIAVGVGLWLALEVARRTPEVWFAASWEVLLAVGAGGTGLLAIAALRGMGARAPLPEALIAIGSMLVIIGLGWSSVAFLSSLFDPPGAASILRPYPIPSILTTGGGIIQAVGFASGRLVPPAGAPADAT
jgi:hypothetical protein